MKAGLTGRTAEGHRTGGPLCLGVLVLLAAAAACGGRGESGQPEPSGDESGAVTSPLTVYKQMGLLAGNEAYPGVASFATMAGPADSTYVLFGLSLPNNALRFQRHEEGFSGEYAVTLTFAQDSQQVARVEQREHVRIPSFAETGRTDESVIFQTLVALPPGGYTVAVEAVDVLSNRGFRARDTIAVPAYGPARTQLASPLFVYRGEGRASAGTSPDLILNPRHTIAYGGGGPRVYLEGYGLPQGQPVTVRILDEGGREVWTARVQLAEGTEELRYSFIDIPPDSLPLGKLWLEAEPTGAGAPSGREPLLVTISDQWMVANFGEVLEFLPYIATSEEVDSLREARGTEQRERWERFWERRDPLPATPINEFREEFFERVRIATEHFSEPGEPGWQTDRGEVYIVLGPPAQAMEQYVGRRDITGQPNAEVWLYESAPGGRLELLFIDRSGFGRYELTPSSESAFRAAANRLRQQQQRA